MVDIKTKEDIERMRESGRIVAELLCCLKNHIAPGVTTAELDGLACAFIEKKKAKPAFKGYRGYPATICSSVNEEIVHGIPGQRKLLEGDIVSIDVGVLYKNFYGDSARTFPVGRVSSEAQRLLKITEEALFKGIEMTTRQNRLSDISHAVQRHVEENGFSVVRDYVGHGIGRLMHEEPQIPNFGPPNLGIKLVPGMVLAIEPMVNAGAFETILRDDGWTAVTADGSLSAHFEHTVAVTDGLPEVLTRL